MGTSLQFSDRLKSTPSSCLPRSPYFRVMGNRCDPQVDTQVDTLPLSQRGSLRLVPNTHARTQKQTTENKTKVGKRADVHLLIGGDPCLIGPDERLRRPHPYHYRPNRRQQQLSHGPRRGRISWIRGGRLRPSGSTAAVFFKNGKTYVEGKKKKKEKRKEKVRKAKDRNGITWKTCITQRWRGAKRRKQRKTEWREESREEVGSPCARSRRGHYGPDRSRTKHRTVLQIPPAWFVNSLDARIGVLSL